MIYRPFQDLQLSTLGMGNMRLPTVGERGPIDEKKAQEILEYAYTHGINYFDTAYRYHGGASEPFVGRVMQQFPRDTWHIASKMPGHQMCVDEHGKLGFQGYLAGLNASVPDIFNARTFKQTNKPGFQSCYIPRIFFKCVTVVF